MVAGSIGTGGHYSRAPCTLKFGFAKERLRGGLGGQQASQRRPRHHARRPANRACRVWRAGRR
ncbi:hypothetical protein CBM2586_B40143 [Cupriavidus phytorum]|uniref:Uncharacterized protein n=1 Tax=Cupriavidus taiwanensis TaxID=164546 RepID=A0A975XKD6_9BURK|nr:hypothetical protein CBM2586_B40143 [Cupriavidus taiwanensis]